MVKAQETVLVTGANRGIGLEVCRQLGRAGARVLLTARDAELGEKAAATLRAEGLDVSFEQLDVASAESIDALTVRLERKGQQLSALVNNAAIAMTERLLPLMQSHGRIVMVSSGGGELEGFSPELRRRLDPPASKEALTALVREFIEDVRSGQHSNKGWPRSAYRVSKAAINGLTRLLAQELEGRQRVNAVCPGWVRTDMGGPDAPRSVEEGADTIVWAATLPPQGPTGGFFRDRKPIPW
jgi:NAD(P)-dependent dehydrogenase (short-subunit alcohol dehydrogenase family)